jgi:hypothetical protein
MATIQRSLDELMTVDGALCAALVDATSGMILGSAGTHAELDLAAAGDTELVRAKQNTLHLLETQDVIEDILVSQRKQYQIIRPLAASEGVFIYLVLDRARANLALARRKTADVERALVV